MASIYDLTTEWERLVALLLTAESEEEQEELLKGLALTESNITDKAENYGYVIKNLQAEVNGLKEEEKRLEAKRKAREHAIERLKSTLFEAMTRLKTPRINAGTFTFSVQQNGGALPVVLDVDIDELPDELCKVKREADKKALAEYMEETGDFSYSHYGERGSSLRIR